MHWWRDIRLAARLARRELRTAWRGFGVFLACLALGVAAVAGVHSLSASFAAALAQDAARLLGGDIEATFAQRPSPSAELAALSAAGTLSHVLTMQVMVRADTGTGKRALATLRAVDAAYPLYGSVKLDPPIPLPDALAERDGLPGVVAAPELLVRTGANVGDTLRVADGVFVIRAKLEREPDVAAGPLSLGPHLLVAERTLATTGLDMTGSLTRHAYRVRLAAPGTASIVAQSLRQRFPQAGWRMRDARTAQPGLARFMDRLTAMTALVGLATLLLGGIGISQAVSGYLAGRTSSIAAMKCLGASRRLIVAIYLMTVCALASVGIAVGLSLGAVTPLLVGPVIGRFLPVHLASGPFFGALGLAAAFGLLTTLTFSLPHLMQAGHITPLALFRGYAAPSRERAKWRDKLPGIFCLTALAILAVAGTPNFRLGLGFVAAVAVAALLFHLFARFTVLTAASLPKGRPGMRRLALAALSRPGNQVGGVLAAIGLGLTTLCAISQIDANFRQTFAVDIPRVAPSYFFIDIQPGQLPSFEATVRNVTGVTRLVTAPMVRGRVVRLHGKPVDANAVAEDARWVVRGDRGLTMAATMPEETWITAGAWWPEDYKGPPLVSVDETLAAGLGLHLGDAVTLNVLGREITATVASLRRINWLTLGINSVFVLSPGALDNLPMTWLATAYTDKRAVGDPAEAVFQAVTTRFPGVTAIGVDEALNAVLDVADSIAAAVTTAATATLAAGMLVLVQTMAAGMRRKAYETVIYKVCGASRKDIVMLLLLENACLGLLAGALALLIGSTVAWAFIRYFLDMPFRLFVTPAVGEVGLAIAATILLGLTGIVRTLSRKAWPVLRNE